MLKIIIINYRSLRSEYFHYSYHNIILDDGKTYNFKKNLKRIHFLKKKLFVLSMWKLTQIIFRNVERMFFKENKNLKQIEESCRIFCYIYNLLINLFWHEIFKINL
jgi:hypothetical protein